MRSILVQGHVHFNPANIIELIMLWALQFIFCMFMSRHANNNPTEKL